MAFLVRGPSRKVLWLPDIDKWEKWDRSLEDFLADPALTAFVDGTFFSADEIPGPLARGDPAPARARRPTALLDDGALARRAASSSST